MSKKTRNVPDEFCKASLPKPTAYTVGELIEHLLKLPKDMPVNQGFEEGCRLTVYNIDIGGHLEVEENEEDWEGDEDE